jgi:hypothetical protein
MSAPRAEETANPMIKYAYAGLFMLVLAACWTIGGCAPKHPVTVAGPKGDSENAELAIFELIVRDLVRSEPKGKSVLVSFGDSWVDHVDPPKAFFARLADVDVSLKPVSWRRQLPSPNAVLLVVHINTWTTDTEAAVSVTRFRFGAGVSDGFTAMVEWSNGDWRIARTADHWST